MKMRAALRKIGRFFRSRDVLLAMLAILLGLLIWFVGPLIPVAGTYPLEPLSIRLACLLFLTLAWGVLSLLMRVRRSSEENALIAALRKREEESTAASDKAQAALDEEFARFRESARHAMTFLRRGRGGIFTNSRYSLPWYLVLGASGAGKSRLISANGLSFVAAEGGDPTQATALPARFCLTEEAVFIEVSGEFLTPDDPQIQLRLSRILDHIRRLRPRQPLNGVLVAIDIQDFVGRDIMDFRQLGASLRRRLDSVRTRLRAAVPVYLTITKFDLLVGFEEFFQTLSIEERAAPFGFAVADDTGKISDNTAATVEKRFSSLVENLVGEQFVRLDEEPDELRRRRLNEFRSQLALLRPKITALVETLASPQKLLGQPPYLRGLFFTSAEQTPEFRDGFISRLAERFAVPAKGMQLAGETGFHTRHTFFLEGLFRKVLLPEAHLGGLTRPAQAMMRGRDLSANVLLLIVAFGLSAVLWNSYSEGRTYTENLATAIDAAKAQIDAATDNGSGPGPIEPVVATLDQFQALSQERAHGLNMGLYGVSSVHEASRDAYDKALSSLLFPYVWSYLKSGLGDPETPAALRFQQLKFYLMLTGSRPLEPAAATDIAEDFVDHWLPENRETDIGARMAGHLGAFAGASLSTPTPSGPLVASARRAIASYTVARIGYDIVRAQPSIRSLPAWRPVDHISFAGPDALARASRTSLWDGISGLYTRTALLDAVQPAALLSAERIAADLWVMGLDTETVNVRHETDAIRDGILDLYRVDYIREWDTLIADLGIVEATTPDEMARVVAILTGTPSPLMELLAAIAAETRLVENTPLIDQLTVAATSRLPKGAMPRQSVSIAQQVTDHFRPFHEAVSAPEGKPAPVDATIAALAPLYGKLNALGTGGDVLELGTETQTLLVALADKIRELPAVLQPVFTRISMQISSVLTGSSRERLSEIWASTVLPACRAATEKRFPFDPKSDTDASLQDFATVFGPKGLIAGFRNDYMKPFIDTTGKPWRWRKGPIDSPKSSADVLRALEMASDITTMYFGESETPKVQFALKPAVLDGKARSMQIDIGKTTLSYAHGPVGETAYQWPPEAVASPVAISLTPEIAGKRNSISRQGSWALFRLLQSGRILEKEPADVVSLRFDIGGRSTILQVISSVTRNPFAQNILADFRCPVL